MPIKKLPLSSGHSMPIIGLGTGKIVKDEDILSTIHSAIQLGYRHFDTAYGYKNETGIGIALQQEIEAGTVTREDLFLATKLPLIGMHPDRVAHFVSLSMKNLRVDYIDLYLIHWPVGLEYVSDDDLVPRNVNGELLLDMKTSLEEVWRAMEDQVYKGNIKSIGLSNFNVSQIQRILKACRIRPGNLQVEIHAYFQQKAVLQFCNEEKIAVCAYAPLGSQGRFSYINAHRLNIPKLFEDNEVKKIAASHEKTPAQILLRFLVQGLNVAVIPKSVNKQRLHENFEIFDFELSQKEIEKLNELDEGETGRSCPPFDGASLHPECPFKC